MNKAVGILKFGGTSVGSGKRIRNVAHIIATTFTSSEEAYPVVVVSAMSKVTDQLLRIARCAYEGEYETVQRELGGLKQKHCEAAEQAIQNAERRSALLQDLEKAFISLERDIARMEVHTDGGGRGLIDRARLARLFESLSRASSTGAINQAPTGHHLQNNFLNSIIAPASLVGIASPGNFIPWSTVR
ncbi:MAG: hypothetical protein M3Z24_17295 [Chloroflexota bacterium]|nr:hypothetical protein [Chloroflexota bacterium]